MKTLRAYKIVFLIFLIFLIVIVLIIINLFKHIKRQDNNESANYDKLYTDTMFMQNNDGGFHAIENADFNIYNFLDSTYYSFSILKSLDNNNLKSQKENISNLLATVDINMLIDGKNYDDVEMCYLYLNLAKITDYILPSNDMKKITNYILNLQDSQGFFYRSNQEKAKIEAKNSWITNKDSIMLLTLYESCTILSNYKNKVNISALQQCIKSLLSNISYDKFDQQDLATISTCIKISNIMNIQEIDQYKKSIGEFYNTALKQISIKSMNTSMLDELFTINKFLNDSNDKVYIISSIESFWCDKAFSIDTETKEPNIKATEILLNIYNKCNINIGNDKRDKILQYINNSKCYDGSYSYIDRESDVYNTYYASLLIKLIGNRYTNNDLINYIKKYFDNSFSESSGAEPILYLQLAKTYSIKIDKKLIIQFFNNQFKIVSSINYSKNIELLLLLLKTAKMYKIEIPDNLYNTMLPYITSYTCENKSIDVEIINKCIHYENLLYFGKKVNSIEIDHLIKLYENNYETLSEKLYTTKWIIDLLIEYGKSSSLLNSNIKSDIANEINKNKRDEFYCFSSNSAESFYSTYEILKINKFLNE